MGPGTLGKTGYSFNGWNTAANGSGTGRATADKFNITDQVTLFAQWRANTYTVSFDAEGGSVSPSSQDQALRLHLRQSVGWHDGRNDAHARVARASF